MPRPRKHLPAGAREFIMAQAESGALQETKAARGLGLSLDKFRRIIRDDPDAAALWREALAVERDALVKRLYERAQEGDVKAASYLLAARHGLREADGGDAGQRSSVVISLPAAASERDWRRIVQADQAQPALAGGEDD